MIMLQRQLPEDDKKSRYVKYLSNARARSTIQFSEASRMMKNHFHERKTIKYLHRYNSSGNEQIFFFPFSRKFGVVKCEKDETHVNRKWDDTNWLKYQFPIRAEEWWDRRNCSAFRIFYEIFAHTTCVIVINDNDSHTHVKSLFYVLSSSEIRFLSPTCFLFIKSNNCARGRKRLIIVLYEQRSVWHFFLLLYANFVKSTWNQVYYTMRKCSINLNLWQHARFDKALVECKISHLNCKVANIFSFPISLLCQSPEFLRRFPPNIFKLWESSQKSGAKKTIVMEKDENIFSHC